MIPTLSQVCTLNSAFEDDIADYSAGHCRALEVWFTKLEDYLERNSISDALRLFDEHEVTPYVASFQGGLLTSQGASRAAAWELFERRLDLCQQMRIGTLVLACDIPAPINQQDVDRTRMSLQQAAQAAGKRELRVAIEFQARAAFGNNLQTAVALTEEIGSPHLGICLDLFHFNVGPSKFADLSLLTAANLFHVQICDLADVPREFAADANRILPGDGDFLIDPVIEHLRQIEYAACVSIELMNPQIWQVPPRQFGEIAVTSLRKLLGQATMD